VTIPAQLAEIEKSLKYIKIESWEDVQKIVRDGVVIE
jgi:hypothetical protein